MSRHILVVEDDAMIQGFLRLTLENDGYRVSAAHSATEMRQFFQSGGIDLIILDLGLPDADGMDLVSEIRAASPLPILVASARQGSEDRVAALERGANDYLTKPFDPAELLLRLKNMLAATPPGAVATGTVPPVRDRRAQRGPGSGDRRAQPSGPGMPGGDRRAQVAPPVPPAYHSQPVNPVPPPAAPSPAPHAAAGQASAEQSLHAAARKSAPPPVHHPPEKASVDKSVIVAGLIAVAAFSGAGVYWFSNSMPSGTGDDRTLSERQFDRQAQIQQSDAAGQPRRGALQPPLEPDVPIARSAPLPQSGQNAPVPPSFASQPPSSANSMTPPTTTPETPSGTGAQANRAPALTIDWVNNSKCAPLPDVKWWRVKSHQEVVRFVNREHNGDWQPYLNNWRARVEKLKDISDRGSGIKTSSGVILQGESLAEYIRDTSDRIDIIQCLSREARIANRR